MNLTKGPLFDALSKLKHATDAKSTLPVLDCIKVESTGTALVLTATDLNVWLRTTVGCDGVVEACIPIKPLLETVKPARRADRDTSVEITVGVENEIIITCSGARTIIQSLPSADYPRHPADAIGPADWKDDGTWEAATLQAALGWVLPAASSDVTRPHLNGVYLDNEAVVCTDGHRLHLARLEGLNSGPTLMPARAMATLLRLLAGQSEIKVSRASDLLRFSVGAWELTTKVMTEKFPPYEMVIPAVSFESFHCIIEPARLREALKHLPKAGRSQGVKLRINGQIFLERETDLGKGSAEVEVVDSSHHGDDYEIGLDGRYLVEALSSGEDLCTIRFGGPLDPVRIEPGDKVAVLMPLRT